ncbi:MAG: fused MFS/spermidine synthase [Phycisphaeraceae bacterium]
MISLLVRYDLRYLMLILAFVVSGWSALIYEVVWFQLLRVTIGGSALALAVVLATYMGGMGLGSWLAPRLVPERWRADRVYGVIEVLIALLGIAMPAVVFGLGRWYVELALAGGGGWWVRSVVCALVLLPPTVLLGATLPVVSRAVAMEGGVASRVGGLYAANLVGATLGGVTAGFVLLPVLDVYATSLVAAGGNLLAAVLVLGAFGFWRAETRSKSAGESSTVDVARLVSTADRWVVLLVVMGSGFMALMAQVVWTRLLSLQFGATVYTFSIIVSVFLAGLGLGSMVGSRVGLRAERSGSGSAALVCLGVAQLLAGLGVAWAMWAIMNVSIEWGRSMIGSTRMDRVFFNDARRALVILLPATLAWGATFPLAVSAWRAGRGRGEPGREVGALLAGNTLGAVGGALIGTLVAIPWLGTLWCQQVLVIGSSALGAAALVVAMCSAGWVELRSSRWLFGLPWWFHGVVMLMLMAWVLSWPVQPADELVLWGRKANVRMLVPESEYLAEGRYASVGVAPVPGAPSHRNLHVSGKVVASTVPEDMRLQRMLGHLPALIHPEPKSVLIVGMGMGTTAGSFVLYPSIERIVICEIEPVVAEAATYFGQVNHDLMDDPRTEVVIDDARHYLATTDERFDIITSDPIHPWVKGAAALYSEEYFALMRDRLKDGGLITQWIPLYETSGEAVKSELVTFFSVLPETTVWSTDLTHAGYDVVLLAGRESVQIDLAAYQSSVEANPLVKRALVEIGFDAMLPMLRMYAGAAADMRGWLADTPVNRDVSLRLEYLAGLSLNQQRSQEIYAELVSHRREPDRVFLGPEDIIRALWERIETPAGR